MKRTALVLLLTSALASTGAAPLPPQAVEAASARAARAISAYVDGPYELYSRGPHTWEAFPSGGNGTFTYQWEVKWDLDPNGTWISTGTDKTTSFTVEDYMGDFELRVKVTSGSEVAYAYWYVNNMQ